MLAPVPFSSPSSCCGFLFCCPCSPVGMSIISLRNSCISTLWLLYSGVGNAEKPHMSKTSCMLSEYFPPDTYFKIASIITYCYRTSASWTTASPECFIITTENISISQKPKWTLKLPEEYRYGWPWENEWRRRDQWISQVLQLQVIDNSMW